MDSLMIDQIDPPSVPGTDLEKQVVKLCCFLQLHSQSVTNIKVSQVFVPWSNVSLTNIFVNWLTFNKGFDQDILVKS